jgi:hypothetical protein
LNGWQCTSHDRTTRRDMRGLLADANVQSYVAYLHHLLMALELWPLLAQLNLRVATFADLNLTPDSGLAGSIGTRVGSSDQRRGRQLAPQPKTGGAVMAVQSETICLRSFVTRDDAGQEHSKLQRRPGVGRVTRAVDARNFR